MKLCYLESKIAVSYTSLSYLFEYLTGALVKMHRLLHTFTKYYSFTFLIETVNEMF
jgi:hypothetical protein